MWMNRTLVVLFIAQLFLLAGAPAMVLVGGLIGLTMAPRPELATLPLAMMVVGTALSAIPASLLMSRVGRKPGFILGGLVMIAACVVAAVSIEHQWFIGFCLSALMFGFNIAFVQQFRFAALESVDVMHHSRAVSALLLGGVVVAFIAPEIMIRFQDVVMNGFAGSFVAMAVAATIGTGLLLLLPNLQMQVETSDVPARPWSAIVITPEFFVAVLCAVTAYGVMTFIMTATPLSMQSHHHNLADTKWVIQSHLVAMFLPSLFTGTFISRFGLGKVMSAGLLCLLATVVIANIDHGFAHYWLGLLMLGVGWNFLFVSATVMVAKSYRSVERFKMQATNDFTVFFVQALASISAGWIFSALGWQWLNLLTVPALLVTALLFFRYKSKLA